MHKDPAQPMILIVDDEPLIRSLLLEVLKDRACKAFPSGLDALAWLEQNPGTPVGLVISDFDLPGGNGVETCKGIRRLVPDIKVILMSGSSVEDVESLALEHHFDGWARKPFSVVEFSRKVLEVLQGVATVR